MMTKKSYKHLKGVRDEKKTGKDSAHTMLHRI